MIQYDYSFDARDESSPTSSPNICPGDEDLEDVKYWKCRRVTWMTLKTLFLPKIANQLNDVINKCYRKSRSITDNA